MVDYNDGSRSTGAKPLLPSQSTVAMHFASRTSFHIQGVWEEQQSSSVKKYVCAITTPLLRL